MDDAIDEIHLLSRANGNARVEITREILQIRRRVRDVPLDPCLADSRTLLLNWIDAELSFDQLYNGTDMQAAKSARDRATAAGNAMTAERRRVQNAS